MEVGKKLHTYERDRFRTECFYHVHYQIIDKERLRIKRVIHLQLEKITDFGWK